MSSVDDELTITSYRISTLLFVRQLSSKNEKVLNQKYKTNDYSPDVDGSVSDKFEREVTTF